MLIYSNCANSEERLVVDIKIEGRYLKTTGAKMLNDKTLLINSAACKAPDTDKLYLEDFNGFIYRRVTYLQPGKMVFIKI